MKFFITMFLSLCPALFWATVFSLPYSVTNEGVTYGADCLANIRLIRNLDGKGFTGGISTSCLTCDIYTLSPPAEGSEITLDGYLLPPFIVTSCRYSENVASVTAYDRCKNLDIPFDYTEFPKTDKNGKGIYYSTSDIVSAAAHQCGFQGGAYSGSVLRMACDGYFQKSCRQILSELAESSGGFFYANGDNLVFSLFSPRQSGTVINPEDRTEIILGGSKTITAIYAEDTANNKECLCGSGRWNNTERMSGRYLTAAVAGEIASRVLGNGGEFVFYGWECASAFTGMIFNVCDCVSYDGKLLPVMNGTYDFTDMGIVASLSAAAPDTSFSEYQDLYFRKIDGKFPFNSLFGCSIATKDGIGYVSLKEAVVNSG